MESLFKSQITKEHENEEHLAKCYNDPNYNCNRYRSGRPITSMPFTNIACKQGHYLPVVRYKIYYSARNTGNQQFCGTFYFYEPESTNYLYLGNYLVAGSKAEALIKLVRESKNTDIPINHMIDTEELISSFDFIAHILSLSGNENITWGHMWEIFRLINNKNYTVKSIQGKLPNFFPLKSVFDKYDQTLCNVAKQLGYDTIILQKEAGKTRFVTEILDVRDRNESYNSFCTIESSIFKQKKELIWYPKDGTIYINKSGNLSIKQEEYEDTNIDFNQGKNILPTLFNHPDLYTLTPILLPILENVDPSLKINNSTVRNIFYDKYKNHHNLIENIDQSFNNF